MTRTFPDRVTNVGNDLTRVAGSFLHSATTGDWTACGFCALPVDGYSLCPQCLWLFPDLAAAASAIAGR